MSLLLLPLTTQAGTYAPVFTNAPATLYSLPTFYSGGACTVNGVSSPYTANSSTASSSSAYGCARLTLFQPASMQCGGAITATWQWMPANASDLPPQNVILVQTSSVFADSGDSYTYGGSAICADGLGGTFVPSNPAYPSAGGTAQSTRYSVVAGGWTVTAPPCTPTASASDTNPFATNMVSVSYSATVIPVTISLTGTTKDSSGTDNILIGQGCTASLNVSGPSGTSITFSNFQWSVSGDTFGGFGMGNTVASFMSPSRPYGHVYPVDPSEYLKPNPHWFWKRGDELGDPETVSCTAQININGVPLPGGVVSCQKALRVWTPSHEFRYHIDPNLSAIYIGAAPSTGIESNIDFDGAVGIPTLFYIAANGHSGIWQFTQLCNLYRLSDPILYVHTITNGFVLDAEFNYSSKDGSPWTADAVDHAIETPSLQTRHASSDSPSVGFSVASSINVNDYFWTYMMYQPPGTDVSWVPLHKMERIWDASVSDFNGTWIPSLPGTQTVTSEGPSSEFPVWDDYFPQQSSP